MARLFNLVPKSLRRPAIFAAALCLFAFAPDLRAQGISVDLDPAATKIDFTLAATMHTVHGTFKLKSGHISVDTATGKASGAIVVDATSAETANSSRDKKMHNEVLESAKFQEIVFAPNLVKGDFSAIISQQRASQVEVSGSFRLHGQDHDATLSISVQPGAAGHIDASTQFPVPYVKWGLKDPSTFILHVADTANLDIHASGKISAAP
jgi:polyisoprenoid-binding protein YceI